MNGIPVAKDQHIRLECLRLVYRHDKDDQTIIDRAEKLAAFVEGDKNKPPPVKGKLDKAQASPE